MSARFPRFLASLLLIPAATSTAWADPPGADAPGADAPGAPPAASTPASAAATVAAPLPAPAPPAAQAPAQPAEYRALRARAPYRAPQWGVGFRFGPHYEWVSDKGLDALSNNDLVLGFYTDLEVRLWRQGPLSAWALGGWSAGGASGTTRGIQNSLTTHNLQAGVEGRYLLWNRLALQARVAPGGRYLSVTSKPTGVGHELFSKQWTWSAEFSGGAALMLAAVGDDEWPSARLWLHASLGYSLSGAAPTKLEADVSDDEKARYGKVTLPDLALSGTQLRVGFGMTF